MSVSTRREGAVDFVFVPFEARGDVCEVGCGVCSGCDCIIDELGHAIALLWLSEAVYDLSEACVDEICRLICVGVWNSFFGQYISRVLCYGLSAT